MKRMFSFGINNFADPSASLNGCVNDVANVRKFAVDRLKFDPKDIRLLCDERATRLNIFERFDWCAKDWNNPNPKDDKLIIQASCHGSRVVDRHGDEVDDMQEEILCPYDFPQLWDSPRGAPDVDGCTKYLGYAPSPQICDDDLAVFLKRIPKGVYTVLIVDACHSGSIDRDINPHRQLNRYLPPPFDIQARGLDRELKTRSFGIKPNEQIRNYNPNVHYVDQRHVLISGCRDDQTSADASINGMSQGAMTWSLLLSLERTGFYENKRPTWVQVHTCMLDLLRQNGYSQVPQLTGPQDMLNSPAFGEF